MEKKANSKIRHMLAAVSALLVAIAMALAVTASPASAAERIGEPDFTSGQMSSHHQHANTMEDDGCWGEGHSATAMTASESAAGGKVTVLVYMNGSDLESYGGAASADIAEMCGSGIGENVNVVIETVGTSQWQDFGIASDHTQRYAVESGELALVDDSLGQLDATAPATLSDFVSWGVSNYPAERYFLILWDHGAGPVYGFGYDEFQREESAMTLDEMKQALDEKAGVRFDFIGMDCCIMGSLETCVALAPYCDYTILSEDFEPGIGWSYERWMSSLESNPKMDTAELGRVIVDDMVDTAALDEENGDATLALIDESKVAALHSAWTDFAYANAEALLSEDISEKLEWDSILATKKAGADDDGACDCGADCGYGFGHVSRPGREYEFDRDFGYDSDCHGYDCDDGQDDSWYYGWLLGAFDVFDDYGCDCGYDDGCGCAWDGEYDDGGWESFWEDWEYDGSDVTMTDYFVTDLGSAASTAGDSAGAALKEALDAAVAYSKTTDGDAGLCGLGVTLPYGDGEFYGALKDVFSKCGFDASYIELLEAFTGVAGQVSDSEAYSLLEA